MAKTQLHLGGGFVNSGNNSNFVSFIYCTNIAKNLPE
jgi:hypothetical protein